MKPDTAARIRSVQKFARNGWQFCSLAGFLLGIFLLATWVKIVGGPRMGGTRIELGTFFRVNSDQLVTVSDKIWTFAVVTVVMGLFAWMLLHLHRLFRRLEAGAIYTKQNVYHLRQTGLASMALALIQLLLPLFSLALADLGYIDSIFVPVVGPDNGVPAFLGPPLSGLITASLILLASWIMDVGRQISDDAEAMRSEADLVI